MQINFRPHHFLCALCFKGKGYSNAFVKNFSALTQTLHAAHGDEKEINIVAHTDSICTPCPHKIGQQCETQEKITQLDNAHAQTLQLEPGTTITWGEGKNRIKENLTLEKFHHMCAPCKWKSYGICETVIKEFIQEIKL